MIYREATINDIPQIQRVRNAVKENRLSDPSKVTGKSWVCEVDRQLCGFAIADLQDDNIWALFVHPDYERKELAGNYTI